jgi:flagellin-like protein
MKFTRNRKAISPVLATVILIAITLIAAIAIAGFVFGLFGSFTSTAQVSATPFAITAAAANTAYAAPTCHAVAGATAPYLQLSNSGTASATANYFTMTFGGHTYTLTPAAGCAVTAGSTEAMQITGVGAAGATVGEQYVGSVAMSNGGAIAFTGTFQ